MRKILLSIMGLFLFGYAALAGPTEVIFESNTDETFIVFINEVKQNSRPVTRLRLNNVQPGQQMVRVRVNKNGWTGFLKRSINFQADYSSTFVVRANARIQNVAINAGSKIFIGQPEPIVHNGGRRGRRNQGGIHSGGSTWHGGNGQWTGGQGQWQSGGRTCPTPNTCLHAQRFPVKALLRQLQCQYFEADRLRLAKRAIHGKSVLAEDVRAIMNTFAFENSRIEFAACAWQFTCDQHNYNTTYSAFQFRSSVRALNRKINYWG